MMRNCILSTALILISITAGCSSYPETKYSPEKAVGIHRVAIIHMILGDLGAFDHVENGRSIMYEPAQLILGENLKTVDRELKAQFGWDIVPHELVTNSPAVKNLARICWESLKRRYPLKSNLYYFTYLPLSTLLDTPLIYTEEPEVRQAITEVCRELKVDAVISAKITFSFAITLTVSQKETKTCMATFLTIWMPDGTPAVISALDGGEKMICSEKIYPIRTGFFTTPTITVDEEMVSDITDTAKMRFKESAGKLKRYLDTNRDVPGKEQK